MERMRASSRVLVAVLLTVMTWGCGGGSASTSTSSGAGTGGSGGVSGAGGQSGELAGSAGGNAGSNDAGGNLGGSGGAGHAGGSTGGDAGANADAGASTGGSSGTGSDAGTSFCAGDAGVASSSSSIAVNGDFSNGTTGWTAFGPSILTAVPTPSRSGNALSVAGRTDTWNGASQSLLGNAKSGQLLQLSAWVEVSVASAPIDFTLKTTVNGVDAYAQIAAGTATNQGFTQLTGSISLSWSADPTSAVFYVEGPPAGATIYVDDVVVSVQQPVGGSGTGNADGSVTVLADIKDKHQVLEGFGASLAWYQNELVRHPKASEIYPIIFGDLGLDILRFRNRYMRSTEVVDLTTEATILGQATQSMGRAPKVVLTSWSPPGSLKASGKEDCTGDTATCTLIKQNGQYAYSAFASYWNDALDAYAAKNITPDYISIQNETDFLPTGWEGCRFDPSESASYPGYDKALKAVAAKLASRTKAPRLIGPETLGVHYNRVQNYAATLDATLLYGWAHHLYEKGSGPTWLWQDVGPDAFVAPMVGALQVEQGKPIFMTEFQTDDDTMTTGGFETGWLMHDSLSDGNASAWLYWDLVWEGSGLVSLDATSYTIRDQYYALRHYAKFTDPGYIRVGATSNLPGIRVTAWLAPDQSRLVLVLLNVGTVDKSVHLSACGYAFSKSSVVRTVFHTDGTSKRWEDLGALGTDPSVQLPSRSMATVVLDR